MAVAYMVLSGIPVFVCVFVCVFFVIVVVVVLSVPLFHYLAKRLPLFVTQT